MGSGAKANKNPQEIINKRNIPTDSGQKNNYAQGGKKKVYDLTCT